MELHKAYKNYKELCKVLEVKIKVGKSKQLQLKEFERYFRYHREGNKFVIDEILITPEDKVDNRKGHSGTSEGSRNNNEVYGTHIDKILLNYFSESDKSIIYTTTNQLSWIVGLINSNYSVASSHKDKYYSYSYEIMNGVVNKVAMWDLFGIIKTSIKSIIRSSLKRLSDSDNKYIDYEESHMIFYNHATRIASKEEEKIIRNIENSVLEKNQVTRKKLQYNDKLMNEYYDEVEELVKKEIDHVDKIFIGYKIHILKSIEQQNVLDDRNYLNKIFMERTNEKMKNITIRTKEKAGNYIGQPNPFWSKFVLERLNFNYMIYTEYVIESLMNINFKNIKEIIINYKAKTHKKMERKKTIETFIDTQNEEDRDMWESVFKEE